MARDRRVEKPHSAKLRKVEIKKRVRREQFTPNNLEDFLIGKISIYKHGADPGSSHVLPELLYNVTPSTKSMGYKSGFQVGLKLSRYHNPSGTIHPLVAALENAGFSNILYHPHRDSAIIEARHSPDHDAGSKIDMHIFEAGIIAGYLTESTGTELGATEIRCVHIGGNTCRFVAERSQELRNIGGFESPDKMPELLGALLAGGKTESRVSDNYFVLQMLPFTRAPINTEVSKLLYLTGGKIALGLRFEESLAKRIAVLFGLSKMSIRHSKRRASVTMRFKRINSIGRYTELVASFVAGVLSGVYGRVPGIERNLNGDGSYTVELTI